MTVYVDDFLTIGASRQDGRRWSYMIANSTDELHRFARHIRVGSIVLEKDRCRLDEAARSTALLLGAEPVSYQQLAAMVALRHLGEDIGDPATARGRRSSYVRASWDADMRYRRHG